MERSVKTYNGMSVSAHAGTGFRFMSSLAVDFLNKNTLNNLHISELFILSLVEAEPRARQYTNFSLNAKGSEGFVPRNFHVLHAGAESTSKCNITKYF